MIIKPRLKIVQLVVATVFLLNSTVYGIDLPVKSYLRVPSIVSVQGRLNEGMTAMLNLKGLSAGQHELLNRAFGEFFDGKNKWASVLSKKEISDIDPESSLSQFSDLQVYVFNINQLEAALKRVGASTKDIAYIKSNLISHPGRFKDTAGAPRASNLFILKEHYYLLKQLAPSLKTQWAKHEAEHLKDITRPEQDIISEFPLYEVTAALKSSMSQLRTTLGSGEVVIQTSSSKRNVRDLAREFIRKMLRKRDLQAFLNLSGTHQELEDLTGYLDSDASAVKFISKSDGINAYTVHAEGKPVIVAVNSGRVFAYPDPKTGIRKAWTKIYGREAFKSLLGREALEDLFTVYQVRDAVTGKDYGKYAVWELLDVGLPVGVPEEFNVQVLQFIKTEEARGKELSEATLSHKLPQILRAAVRGEVMEGTDSPVELLYDEIKKYASNPDDLSAILTDLISLERKDAIGIFGEDGIPPVMALVAALYPKFLESMASWDEGVYDLLRGIIDNPSNRDLFEMGSTQIYGKDNVDSRNALVISRSYRGRRVFIPIHFSRTFYNPQDGKAWFRIRGVDPGVGDKHIVYDHVIQAWYQKERTRAEIRAGWDIDVPVKLQSGQRGLCFQILEFDSGPAVENAETPSVKSFRPEDYALEPRPQDAPPLEALPPIGTLMPRPENWKNAAILMEFDVRGYGMAKLPDGSVHQGSFSDIERNLERIYDRFFKDGNPDIKPVIYIKGASDSQSGTEEDYQRLISRAHSLGMLVIEDFTPINLFSEKTIEYFLDVIQHRISKYGVDGFRLDVAHAMLKSIIWKNWKEFSGMDAKTFNEQYPAMLQNILWKRWGQHSGMTRENFDAAYASAEPLNLFIRYANTISPGTVFFLESYEETKDVESIIEPDLRRYVSVFQGGQLMGNHGFYAGALNEAIHRSKPGSMAELRQCIIEGFINPDKEGLKRYAFAEDHDAEERIVQKVGKGGALLTAAVLLAIPCIPGVWNGQTIGTKSQVSRDNIVVQGRQLGGVNWDELDPEFAATWKVVWDTLGKDIVFRKGEAELLVVEDPEGRPVEDMFAIARTYIDENGHLQRRIFVANFSGSKVSGFMRFPKELRVNQYDEYGLRNLATGELLSRHYPGEYSGRKLSDEGLFVELEPFSKDDVPALDLPFMQVLNLFPEDRTLEPLFEELAGLKTLEEVDVFETAHPALISRLEKAIFERRQDILLKGLNELTTVEAVDEFADLHPYVSASIKDAIAGRREDILSNELKLLTGTRKAIREFIEKRVPGRRAMEESILLAQKYFVEEVNQDFQNTLFIATESGQRFKPTDAFFRRLFDKEQLELFARYLDDEDENIQHIAKVILADYIHSLPPRSLADFIQMVRAMDSPDTAMHRHPELFLGEIKNNPGHVKAMRFIENPSMSRVVFLTSEAAPWTRIGGMGQVMSSLSGSLADLSLTEEDVDATVIMPLYHGAERTMDPQEFADRLSTPLQQLQVPMPGAKMAAVSWLLEGNVTYFFIDNREFFSGNVYSNENQENGRRFAFFTIAALEALNAMNMGVHTLVANDYHSALAPVLLKYGAQRKYEVFKHTKTIQIVHVFEENMGRFEQSLMGEFGIPWEAFNSDCLEDYGKVNVIKGGLHSADHCLTVSKSEARRLLATFGYLFGTLKHWIGILNRISVIFWSPDSEKLLEGCRYNKFDDIATIKSHKAKNKANLQKRFNNLHEGPKVFGHLDENPNAFLIGMIGSRGVKQKGVDIAVGAIRMLLKDPSRAKYEVERILRESGSELDDSTRRVLNKFLEIDNLEDFFKNVQFVWYANADSEYGKMLIQLAKDCPGKVVVNIDYNDDSAMEYYAASDINLMPSRFEPGGYPQQICQRFATIPIVYRTGGLEDAVPTYNIDTRQGVGLAYPGFGYGNSEDLLVALTWALELYRASEGSDFSGHWDQMLRNAIDEDVSWARSIKEYLEIFHEDRNNILSELKEGEYFYGVAKPSPESAMRLDGGKELEERFMAHNEVRSNL